MMLVDVTYASNHGRFMKISTTFSNRPSKLKRKN
jgi:hypothetical protein